MILIYSDSEQWNFLHSCCTFIVKYRSERKNSLTGGQHIVKNTNRSRMLTRGQRRIRGVWRIQRWYKCTSKCPGLTHSSPDYHYHRVDQWPSWSMSWLSNGLVKWSSWSMDKFDGRVDWSSWSMGKFINGQVQWESLSMGEFNGRVDQWASWLVELINGQVQWASLLVQLINGRVPWASL